MDVRWQGAVRSGTSCAAQAQAHVPPEGTRTLPARVVLAACLLFAAGTVVAQDLSTQAILRPVSGCAMNNSEAVQIRVVNRGSTLPPGSIFSMSYTINGGAPVVETVFRGNPLPPNGTFLHTFGLRADLSAPGEYLVEATVSYADDVDHDNDAHPGQLVRHTAPSQSGSIAAPPAGTTQGVLVLSGHSGDVIEWQQSIDGQRWRALQNTSASQPFALIAQPTLFRAVVRNDPCPAATGAAARVAPEVIHADGFEP